MTTSEEKALTDCWFFFNQLCSKSACEFRHSDEALYVTTVCPGWVIGSCTNIQCSSRHPQKKKAPEPSKNICYYYSKGFCRAGINCSFFHPAAKQATNGAPPVTYLQQPQVDPDHDDIIVKTTSAPSTPAGASAPITLPASGLGRVEQRLAQRRAAKAGPVVLSKAVKTKLVARRENVRAPAVPLGDQAVIPVPRVNAAPSSAAPAKAKTKLKPSKKDNTEFEVKSFAEIMREKRALKQKLAESKPAPPAPAPKGAVLSARRRRIMEQKSKQEALKAKLLAAASDAPSVPAAPAAAPAAPAAAPVAPAAAPVAPAAAPAPTLSSPAVVAKAVAPASTVPAIQESKEPKLPTVVIPSETTPAVAASPAASSNKRRATTPRGDILSPASKKQRSIDTTDEDFEAEMAELEDLV